MRAKAPGFDPRLFLRDEELDYGLALVLAASDILQQSATELALEQEIPVLAARVLVTIRFEPGQSVSDLRVRLGATVPTLARILGDLDKRGLIERRKSPADGRARQLYLSFEGKRATDPATIAMRDRLRQAYRRAGASSVEGARTVLEALR